MKHSTIRKKRPGPTRRGPLRNPRYRHWATLQPCDACLACGLVTDTSCLAHGPVGGTSQKGPDNEGIVLCWGFGSLRHHEEQHRIDWPMFEAKYGINRAELAAAHWARYLKSRGGKP